MNTTPTSSSRPARRDQPHHQRPLTIHQTVNLLEVQAGKDTHYRALCGHTFPARYGHTTATRRASSRAYIWCAACETMQQLQLELEAPGRLQPDR